MLPKNLILYFMPTCRYCQKVIEVINELNVPVSYKDISANPGDKESLHSMMGNTMVPCLVIDGKPMQESADIIAYLKTTFKN